MSNLHSVNIVQNLPTHRSVTVRIKVRFSGMYAYARKEVRVDLLES